MQVRTALRAAGSSHPGLVRDHNEDRFHYDSDRGIFIVVDGVGGQAAGEKAAETALAKLRDRLERETESIPLRIREAIINANNEILRLARLRPEWEGMACVLTLVVVEGQQAHVGHVGDTRLYKIRGGRIQKLTRDHSPVGEREDAGELSEADAMRHPRRNEVYRDVGSEEHRLDDDDFVDTFTVPFEPDAALLLCSDGLSDLVNAETILQRIEAYAGHPYEVARALVQAANDAGGKDNVTAVYVEGPRFAEGEDTGAVRRPPRQNVAREPIAPLPSAGVGRAARLSSILLLLSGIVAWSIYHAGDFVPTSPAAPTPVADESTIVVGVGGSIAAAIARAQPGTVILVEPGEYREQLQLKMGVHVRSRVPRGATLRLPTTAREEDAAVTAQDALDVELRGFRIIGDAATPLGIGVRVQQSDLVLVDVTIQGARGSAIQFGAGASGGILGSDLHENPGIAIDVRSGATPRITANRFERNATARAAATIIVEPGARPSIERNVFVGASPQSIVLPDGTQAGPIATTNWFITPPRTPARDTRGGTRPGSQ